MKTKSLTQVGFIMLSGRELLQFLSDRERSLRRIIRDCPDEKEAALAELEQVHAYRALVTEPKQLELELHSGTGEQKKPNLFKRFFNFLRTHVFGESG